LTGRAIVFGGFVAVVAALGACGDDGHDVATEAEAGVAAVLAERLDVPIASIGVTCPEDLDPEPGDTFTCDVSVTDDPTAASAVAIELAVSDDGTIELQRAVIPTAAARDYLTQALGPTAEGPVSVDCGPQALLVRSVGESFDCTATRTADGVQFRVVVNVVAVDGTVDYRVERTTTTAAPTTPTTRPTTDAPTTATIGPP
jgi:Domain of unknown function (DUF4333)